MVAESSGDQGLAVVVVSSVVQVLVGRGELPPPASCHDERTGDDSVVVVVEVEVDDDVKQGPLLPSIAEIETLRLRA